MDGKGKYLDNELFLPKYRAYREPLLLSAKDPSDSDKLYDKCEFLLLGLLIEQVMDLYLIIISIMFIVSVLLVSFSVLSTFVDATYIT